MIKPKLKIGDTSIYTSDVPKSIERIRTQRLGWASKAAIKLIKK